MNAKKKIFFHLICKIREKKEQAGLKKSFYRTVVY